MIPKGCDAVWGVTDQDDPYGGDAHVCSLPVHDGAHECACGNKTKRPQLEPLDGSPSGGRLEP